MWKYIINDFVIKPEVCNNRCEYCGLRIEKVPRYFRDGELIGLKGNNGEIVNAENVYDIVNNIEQILLNLNKYCSFHILKLSGGEITLYPEIIEYLSSISSQYSFIKILTNGKLLNKSIIDLLNINKNLILQISLDGNDKKSNKARGLSKKNIDNIFKIIHSCVKKDIKVEFNTVLTKYNIDFFWEFAENLTRISNNNFGKLIIFPRPVRGNSMKTLYPLYNQIKAFRKQSMNSLNKYTVLPPFSYFERILNVMENKKRNLNCYVPYFILSSNDNGNHDLCTCNSIEGIWGNSLEIDENFQKVITHGSLFKPDSMVCMESGCINQFEIFNLFMEDKIDCKELALIPTFSNKEILRSIITIKNELKNRME